MSAEPHRRRLAGDLDDEHESVADPANAAPVLTERSGQSCANPLAIRRNTLRVN